MQFGVFTVGDVTPDPTTGTAPSEGERIELPIVFRFPARHSFGQVGI